MVANIRCGSSPGGALHYNREKVDKGEAEVLLFQKMLNHYDRNGRLDVNADFGIVDLLQPLASQRSQPLFERLGFGRGNGLHEAEKLLGICYVCHAHLAVGGRHFQTVTNCHGFIAFGLQTLF